MLEALTQEHAPASNSYEPIRQLLQTLSHQYDPIDFSNARQLAQQLRSIAKQLEAASETPAIAERSFKDDAIHGNAFGLESLEKNWAAASPEQGDSGMLSGLRCLQHSSC